MGLWLNDRQIQKIVAKLDFKFSDSVQGINKIRSRPARRARFDAGGGGGARKLHKIARQTRIWGDNGGPATPHSKRWWAFLLKLHTTANNAPGGSADCAEDIKTYIRTALDDLDCVAIKFVAVEGTDVRVTSSAIPLPLDISKYITLIIMQTIAHDGTAEPDPGSDGEDPPGDDPLAVVTSAAGMRTKSAKKKSAKKKSAKKKSAKKKAAK